MSKLEEGREEEKERGRKEGREGKAKVGRGSIASCVLP